MRRTALAILLGWLVPCAGLTAAGTAAQASVTEACDVVDTSVPRQTPAGRVAAQTASGLAGDTAVLVLGDSIAHRWPDDQLKSALGATPVKLAVGGDRLENTTWILDRIKSGVHPRTVLIVGGTNNVNHDPACAFDRRLETLMSEARDRFPSARIYELNITPKGVGLGAFASNIGAANSYMREAALRHHIVLVDGFTALSKACAALSGPDCPLLEADRLHPTPAGFQILTAALANAAQDVSKQN